MSREAPSLAIADPDCELLVAVYASVLAPGSATYCSAPITSGRRFAAWVARTGATVRTIDDASEAERETHLAEVVRPNQRHAHEVVSRLRHGGQVVIDPTSVPHQPGWTQPQWLAFWEVVIERFAREVVFVDGWEFSNGCAHEFAFAMACGLPCADERGVSLDAARGAALIRQAIGELAPLGVYTARLEAVVASLRAG